MKKLLSILFFCFFAFPSSAQKIDVMEELGFPDFDNPEIQFILGDMFYRGEGQTTPNIDEALRWFNKSAEQGYAQAQFFLGLMYFSGDGVPLDYHIARDWFTQAANQKHADAQAFLGIMYTQGYGVRQSFEQAAFYLSQSAAQNNKVAYYGLAIFYEQGLGVRQNLDTAKDYYGKACDAGSQEACNEYARLNTGRR